MKIISWNCNMAFRKKHERIIEQSPDLLIIQECENKDKLQKALETFQHNEIIWYGRNPHKGLAVISFNNVHIERAEDFNAEYEYVLPIKMKVGRQKINLFAIWAMPHQTDRKKNYVGQVWGAINYYKEELKKNCILIGDFNSNALWDNKIKTGNHSDVVKFLNDHKIYSLYHRQEYIKHGDEKDPTIYLLKNKEKPYHLDYCFCSKSLITKTTTIEVGQHDDWIKLSDHMPIIVENLS